MQSLQPERGFVDWVSQLARTYSRALTSIAQSEGLSADDAVDAVQEAFHTFLALKQARALFERDEGPDPARALLSTLAELGEKHEAPAPSREAS